MVLLCFQICIILAACYNANTTTFDWSLHVALVWFLIIILWTNLLNSTNAWQGRLYCLPMLLQSLCTSGAHIAPSANQASFPVKIWALCGISTIIILVYRQTQHYLLCWQGHCWYSRLVQQALWILLQWSWQSCTPFALSQLPPLAHHQHTCLLPNESNDNSCQKHPYWSCIWWNAWNALGQMHPTRSCPDILCSTSTQ